MNTNKIWHDEYSRFENLYDEYSPKMYGFIRMYAETKEQAEYYLKKVFLQVWMDINDFENNTEKKILNLVLTICKSAIKLKRDKDKIQYSEAI